MIPIPGIDEIQQAVRAALDEHAHQAGAERCLAGDLRPAKLYSRAEVADLLGVHVDTVSRIPANELPKTRGKYLGINVMCYQAGLPPVDYEAIARRHRDQMMQSAPAVRTIPGGAKSRRRVH